MSNEETKELLNNDSISEDWVIKLKERVQRSILPEMHAAKTQCIYRVSPEIRQVNPEAFTPKVVCIGPFHRPPAEPAAADGKLWSHMEELKLKYLKAFLDRTCKGVEDIVPKLQEWENKIRSCYSMILNYESNELIKIVLVDACFIIEHLLVSRNPTSDNERALLLKEEWLLNHHVERDLLLLENQLPFFVLDDIYNFCGFGDGNGAASFFDVAFDYFKDYHNDPKKGQEPVGGYPTPKHFTDLVRTYMIPTSFFINHAKLYKGRHSLQKEYDDNGQHVKKEDDKGKNTCWPLSSSLFTYCPLSSSSFKNVEEEKHYVPSASELSERGLIFKVSKDKEKFFLELEFKKNELRMPRFRIHYSTEVCMRNVLAFEELNRPPEQSYMSQYFKILDFLIDKEKDVEILIRHGIIDNLMGDANEVVKLINNLCRNLFMPPFSKKYVELLKGLNGFHENIWNKYKAIFKRDYLNTPWKIASTTVAVVLLVLTLIQTICSVIQVVQGSKQPK